MATRFESIWNDNVAPIVEQDIHDRTGYSHREIIQGHLEMFMSLPGMADEPRQEQYYFWERYLDAMVGYSTLEKRERFFQDVGIYSSDFDWEAWRSAMGYERRNN
jgi:hypothetical protein